MWCSHVWFVHVKPSMPVSLQIWQNQLVAGFCMILWDSSYHVRSFRFTTNNIINSFSKKIGWFSNLSSGNPVPQMSSLNFVRTPVELAPSFPPTSRPLCEPTVARWNVASGESQRLELAVCRQVRNKEHPPTARMKKGMTPTGRDGVSDIEVLM